MKIVNAKEMRELIKKYPDLYIWDKDFKSWDIEDFKAFENAKFGVTSKKIPLIDARLFGYKVIRVSDGKIYQSVSDCIRQNGFDKNKMYQILKEGIIFKKLKHESKKIIRLSDGKKYNKILDAKISNKLTDYKMRKKLRLGIEFKYIE